MLFIALGSYRHIFFLLDFFDPAVNLSGSILWVHNPVWNHFIMFALHMQNPQQQILFLIIVIFMLSINTVDSSKVSAWPFRPGIDKKTPDFLHIFGAVFGENL